MPDYIIDRREPALHHGAFLPALAEVPAVAEASAAYDAAIAARDEALDALEDTPDPEEVVQQARVAARQAARRGDPLPEQDLDLAGLQVRRDYAASLVSARTQEARRAASALDAALAEALADRETLEGFSERAREALARSREAFSAYVAARHAAHAAYSTAREAWDVGLAGLGAGQQSQRDAMLMLTFPPPNPVPNTTPLLNEFAEATSLDPLSTASDLLRKGPEPSDNGYRQGRALWHAAVSLVGALQRKA
jgi:hypothetical protein